jgi:hypothetical protein
MPPSPKDDKVKPGGTQGGPDSAAPKSGSGDPEMSATLSLEALGVSKRMRLVLLVLLSIFGTIETWVWCKAIWHWKFGDKKVETATKGA